MWEKTIKQLFGEIGKIQTKTIEFLWGKIMKILYIWIYGLYSLDTLNQ